MKKLSLFLITENVLTISMCLF